MHSFGLLSLLPYLGLVSSAMASPSTQSTDASQSPSNTTTMLVPYRYSLLDIREVKPEGWIEDQLQLQANGLSGNLVSFYRYVKESTWLGGTEEHSELHESAPYWYNAIVPLAYVLDDQRLKSQANMFLHHVLDHQADDGWLGPETTRQTRGIWARCLLLQGMMNHAIADPDQEDKIITAMHRFVSIANSMLKNNYTGYIQQPGDNFDPYGFGVVRAHELSTSLQWLYDVHPRGNEMMIWETMDLMWAGAIVAKRDWSNFFVDGVFPTQGTPIAKAKINFEHGVNMAQGLRFMAQKYRMTRNQSLVDQTRAAVDMTFRYQGTDSGSITADEYVGGTSPQRGSELCMSVESIFSLSYLYRLLGDNAFADRAELAAFNAFPAAISPDFWSHQYVTQTNQPWSQNLTGKPFFNVVSYGNVFGLEPNFPCCTVNHGQALPKFVMSSFVSTSDSGLVQMFLIPATVSTKIKGKKVDIECETAYPFGSVLRYKIQSTGNFDFFVRIPEWALSTSTVKINQGYAQSIDTSEASLQKIKISPGTTSIEINLEAETRVVPKPNNTVAIYHGALFYALDINYTTAKHPARSWLSHEPIPANETDPRALDHTLTPTTPWKVAIDPSQLRFESFLKDGKKLPNPIFARGAPPIVIWAAAQEIEWPVSKGTADMPPDPVELVGSPFWARLVPYGSAKLHMGQLPSVSLPKLDSP